jgi:hypothetical protein
MKPRLYMETTIPSLLTARPSKLPEVVAMQNSTKKWWQQRLADFDVFVSAEVENEAGRGDAEMARLRMESISTFPLLPLTPTVVLLSGEILKLGLIPSKAASDATHLAFATVHGMDFLLTWNCTHINNGEVERRLRPVCWAHGYQLPVIVSPDELMTPLP